MIKRRKLKDILTEFCRAMELIRIIKRCLYETYDNVHIRKYLSDAFNIRNVLKQGGGLWTLLFKFALE
jgi:hypothetical protein